MRVADVASWEVTAEASPKRFSKMAIKTVVAGALGEGFEIYDFLVFSFFGSAQFIATGVVAYTGDPRSIAGIIALATAMSLLLLLRIHRQTTVGVRSSSN